MQQDDVLVGLFIRPEWLNYVGLFWHLCHHSQQPLILSGPKGVGKKTFLRYASTWPEREGIPIHMLLVQPEWCEADLIKAVGQKLWPHETIKLRNVDELSLQLLGEQSVLIVLLGVERLNRAVLLSLSPSPVQRIQSLRWLLVTSSPSSLMQYLPQAHLFEVTPLDKQQFWQYARGDWRRLEKLPLMGMYRTWKAWRACRGVLGYMDNPHPESLPKQSRRFRMGGVAAVLFRSRYYLLSAMALAALMYYASLQEHLMRHAVAPKAISTPVVPMPVSAPAKRVFAYSQLPLLPEAKLPGFSMTTLPHWRQYANVHILPKVRLAQAPHFHQAKPAHKKTKKSLQKSYIVQYAATHHRQKAFLMVKKHPNWRVYRTLKGEGDWYIISSRRYKTLALAENALSHVDVASLPGRPWVRALHSNWRRLDIPEIAY